MTALLFNDNGSFKEVKAINWLYRHSGECEDVYLQDKDIYGPGYCTLVVLVSKYRTFKTGSLSIDTVKELFEDSKFDHVAKHY